MENCKANTNHFFYRHTNLITLERNNKYINTIGIIVEKRMSTVWGHRALSTNREWEKGCESLAMENPVDSVKRCMGLMGGFPVWEDWKQWSYYLGEVKSWRVANPEIAEFLLFVGKLKWDLEKRVGKGNII